MSKHKKYVVFPGRILIVGFGAVGQGSLPLILRHIDIPPERITIITAEKFGREIAKKYGVKFIHLPITRENYIALYDKHLARGDFLVNASFNVNSIDSIEYCQQRGILYIDACIEPWAGGHRDTSITPGERSNYAFRQYALDLRKKYPNGPTNVLMHGANPGLVSHFVKQALLNVASDAGLKLSKPASQKEWAGLARVLGVKIIQISERDHQTTKLRKRENEFCNTWSSEAFTGESLQPAELGWGTHERHWPCDGKEFGFGCGAAIYLNRTGASTRVRSWAPIEGPFHGFLISHGESTSIPDYFTVREGGKAVYRPTCYYAYHPCDDAVLSMLEFNENEYRLQPKLRLLRDEISDGVDELGVFLMGHKRGGYWFGSHLSIHQARKLAPYNNATCLQVNMPYVGAIIWAMKNQGQGIVDPDMIPFEDVLNVSKPYLGKLVGVYTDWTPLKERANLYPEDVDTQDPWQFKNFRVG